MGNKQDSSLGEGVYYDRNAYAGFGRRLVAIVIDFIVLVVFLQLVWLTLILFAWDRATGEFTLNPYGPLYGSGLIFTWWYLTLLKRSSWRTVGYRFTGLKIVDLHGNKPSFGKMTFRAFMWFFGPFNLLFDLLWLGADTEGQSLRDCYAGTYVVRNNTEPLGHAPMHLARYNALGMTLVYPRVVHPRKDSSAG